MNQGAMRMRKLAILFSLLLFSSFTWAQTELRELVKVDHSWVRGSYWNPEALPNWGFFVDVQEETMFGSLYGYKEDKPTFVVFVGNQSSAEPLVYQGEVYFVIEPGVTEELVGEFTWSVTMDKATPSANLNITSNILNVTDLQLGRFGFAEVDKIDIVSGGNWNIVRRVNRTSFSDHYVITDERSVDDGITYVSVTDLANPDLNGVAGHFSSEGGDFFSMMMPFSEAANVFYVFYATHTDMYGRYWILEPGEEPSGEGSYFRAAVDNTQQSAKATSESRSPGKKDGSSTETGYLIYDPVQAEMRALELNEFKETRPLVIGWYNALGVGIAYTKLSARLEPSQ
jgi:hypothetical protein